jgi:AbrB family looped-hinge helix DNA binding protein
MPVIRIGQRGRITIPSALRQELRLEEGERLIARVNGRELVLAPAGRPLLSLRGSVPVDGPQDFEAIRAQVVHERARRMIGQVDR